jgi:hypothetical protein
MNVAGRARKNRIGTSPHETFRLNQYRKIPRIRSEKSLKNNTTSILIALGMILSTA